MKSDKLFDAIGEARGEYVQDAGVVPAAKRYGWVKWAAVAACVLVAVLIAVPALKGKAPEVEPEPSEPTPVEAPVDEPKVEPADEPETEAVELKDRLAVAEEYYANGGTAGGGTGATSSEVGLFGMKAYTYEDYLEAYTAIRENPVFAALFDDPETQQFDVVHIGLPTEIANYESIDMVVDGFTILAADAPFDHSVCVQHYESDALNETWESALTGIQSTLGEPIEEQFAQAESLGVRTDYQVDGVEVQKYSQNDYWRASDSPMYQEDSDENTFWERIVVDGDWYVIYGDLEADVDTIASVVARIVSQL